MYKLGKYTSSDSMSDLICDNYPMLFVMSRFGISLGFGEKTISQVCRLSGVDENTFLAVVNLLISKIRDETAKPSLPCLLKYLRNSHSHFLISVFLPSGRNWWPPRAGNMTKRSVPSSNSMTNTWNRCIHTWITKKKPYSLMSNLY